VNVVALRAPKQEPETKSARMREPTGPKTCDPKATATVLEDSMTEVGRTRKYDMLARM
jgi:hypothetical protein